ncbi:MAG: RNA methyltransferase [Deltaproteobacteria bacterium]|nr:RNA methyltransferase [Deltaproteobacteria bacterium]
MRESRDGQGFRRQNLAQESDSYRDREVREEREDGHLLYGLHAAKAALAARGDDVLRLAIAPALLESFDALLKPLRAREIVPRVMSVDSLDRLAQSKHHEGVLLWMRPRQTLSAESVADVLLRGRGLAIAFDRVQNPHNLGAVLRTGAFFGVDVAIVEGPEGQNPLPAAALRIAEGGAESVTFVRVPSLARMLERLRGRGVSVLGTDRASRRSLFETQVKRPSVMVLGNERQGLSPEVRAQCDVVVSIPGSATVDSLNVSVAAGVLISHAVHGGRVTDRGA